MTLTFPDLDTLHFAVSSDLVPPTTLNSSLHVQSKSDGIWINSQSAWPAEQIKALTRLGVVASDHGLTNGSVRFDHWLQLFPLTKQRQQMEIGQQTPILFELRNPSQFVPLINELLRQGHDRSGITQFTLDGRDRVFIRIIGPPYYTLLTALDGGKESPTAFREASPQVWIQVGFDHPFARQMHVAEGRMLLLRPECNWEMLEPGPFNDISEILDIAAPVPRQALATQLTEPISVPLTLSPSASTEAAGLWIVRQNAIAQMDDLVQHADARVRSQLAFAVAEMEGETVVVLRLRPTKLPPPNLTLVAEAYRPWLRLPNLFVPIGIRIDPPLRRDTIQKMLATDAATIGWLTLAGNTFHWETMADEAFQPLSAWIDRVLERDRETLTQWTQSTEFGFAGVAMEEPVKPAPAVEKKARPPREPSKTGDKPEPAPQRERRPQRRPAPIAEEPRRTLPADNSALREQLTAVETEFLAIEGPLDDPQRLQLWPRLAELNAALHQPGEAELAWAHAMWDAEQPSVDQLWQWVLAENALQKTEVTIGDVDRLLAPVPAAVGDVRAMAAVVVWAAASNQIGSLRERLANVQAFFLANERLLPVRVTWLTWCAWSKLAGADTLALVRARDRLLSRLLERGLDGDADLPTFLRFAGRADSDRLRGVREWIDDVRLRVRDWYRKQTHTDMKRDPTAAYIDLFFAFGLARLGEAFAARAFVKQSETILEDVGDDTRDAHLVMLQALNWRVEQLLAGKPHAGPLPPEVLDFLAQMHTETKPLPRTNEYDKRRTGPYAVERFREQSRIMEPLEKFDPYRHTRREGHDLVREAAKLPDLREPASLAIRIKQLLRPTEGVPELRLRVLAECVPMAGRLGVEAASELLDTSARTLVVANPTTDGPALEVRLRLIERSLFFSAHFDRNDLVPVFVDQLVKLFESDAATVALESSWYAMGQTLRSLRKLAVRDDTTRILERLESALLRGNSVEAMSERPPRNWPAIVQTLLHVAAGWINFDRADRAEPILAAARRLLFRNDRTGGDELPRSLYVQLLCNLITALGYYPPAEARSRITDIFAREKIDRLPNTFTTGSFYSRFHLNVAEAVVLTLSGEDFTLGPAARRWLDEDEYLIRRRVHRDVRAALERE